mgnify:CR=1 FL=1
MTEVHQPYGIHLVPPHPAEQLDAFSPPLEPPAPSGIPGSGRSRYDQLYAKFQAFDAAHPDVWIAFERRALTLHGQGHTNYSSRTILEWMRWHTEHTPGGSDYQFKVNDHFPPFYARKFMQHYPDLVEFFRMREQPSLHAPPTIRRELEPIDFDGPRDPRDG